MTEMYRYCLLLAAAVYLTVIVHEVGHALAGRALGFVVTSLGAGTAGPFLVVPIGRARFYLGLRHPFQGITFAFLPRPDLDQRRLAAFVAGGMAANAISAVAALGLALGLPPGGPAIFCGLFAAVNAVIGASNLLPFHMNVGRGTLRSDGKILLDLCRSGSMTAPPSDVIQAATGCRPLWRAIGDRRMHRLYALGAASSWLDLGSATRAEAFYAEAVAVDGPHPHIEWLEAFVRTSLALARGEAVEARAALARAEGCSDPAAPAGRYLVALLRALLRQVEGDPDAALAEFARLAADPVGERRPDLGSAALAAHLGAACLAGDRDAVAALRARYESRRPRPSVLCDLHVYGAAARFAAARGEDARDDYRRALRAIAALAAPWRDPADKAAFLEAQRGLLEAARLALDPEDAAALIGTIEAHPADGPLMGRDEAFRRWALRLMLINAASLVPLVLAALALGRPRGAPAGFLAVLLAASLLVGVPYLLVAFAVGKVFPSSPRLGGSVLLALAVMPWVGGLAFAFLAIAFP